MVTTNNKMSSHLITKFKDNRVIHKVPQIKLELLGPSFLKTGDEMRSQDEDSPHKKKRG
jgi:hypothetical protein